MPLELRLADLSGFFYEDQFRAVGNGKCEVDPVVSQVATALHQVRQTPVLIMQPILPGRLQSVKTECVRLIIHRGAVEGIDDRSPAPRIVVFDAIPMHSVWARGDVIQICIADEGT